MAQTIIVLVVCAYELNTLLVMCTHESKYIIQMVQTIIVTCDGCYIVIVYNRVVLCAGVP